MLFMKKFFTVFIFSAIVFPLISQAQNFGGNPAYTKWRQVENDHFKVVFPAGLDSQARRILEVNTVLQEKTLPTIGSRTRKWNIVLQNKTTISNAYVRLAPKLSEYFLTPGQDNFSLGSLRWDDNLAIHENRHVQQLANFNKGFTRVFSFFLGQEGQLLANGITIPDYFFEGDAVYQETLVSEQGRGRLPEFYNGIKSLWLANKSYSWMKLRSGSLKDFTPGHYEVGYMLVAYGFDKYGKDFWKKVTEDAVRFRGVFYAFNRAIERHSGVSYKRFRNDALNYFKGKTRVEETKNENTNYLTKTQKNNVVSYKFPAEVNADTLIVSRSANDEPSSFYFLANGKETKLREKDVVIDEYFSYRNGNIVYSAFNSDPLRGNRDYSDIRVLNVRTNEQKNITRKSKYFSPDINEAGTKIIAVQVNPDGTNMLHELNASSGVVERKVPNLYNYFYTQTKYLNGEAVISAVRNPKGEMALIETQLNDGSTKILTPFSYNVLGYPSIKNDTVYFSKMNKSERHTADMVFALDLKTLQQYQLTDNVNGIYAPIFTLSNKLITNRFSAEGERISETPGNQLKWLPVNKKNESKISGIVFSDSALSGLLSSIPQAVNATTSPYQKAPHLFNFHSARPVQSATEYGYEFYSDNILSNFKSTARYVYNRNERSSAVSLQGIFAGVSPFFTGGFTYTFNRHIDTALNRGIDFNSAKVNVGAYIPLRFVGGRTVKNLQFGGGYNVEQIPYIGIGKNVFSNTGFKYMNTFLSFANMARTAIQNINPRWGQAVSVSYRQAFNYFETKKLVSAASLFLPGLSRNHSLVLQGSFQRRDSLPDFFSDNYDGARGYEPLNTRMMYKAAVNYHFPICYPDVGVGNIFFLQRIRANVFYDYNISRLRYRSKLADIKYRSAGTEVFFEGKLWNALSAGIGVRYSHLLDPDLQYPGNKNQFEIVLPFNIIPD